MKYIKKNAGLLRSVRSWGVLGLVLALAGIMGSAQTSPPPGMVSWWPGDGNANDIVDGNQGTPENGAAFVAGTFAPGMVGQAFSFDGKHDGISIAKTANLNMMAGNFSIDAWVNITSLPPPPHRAVIFMNYAGVPFYGLFITAAGRAQVTFRPGGPNFPTTCDPLSGCVEATGNTILNINQWYHLVGVRDGLTTAQIYVNSIPDGNGTNPTYTGPGVVDTSPCLYARIGANHTSGPPQATMNHCQSQFSNLNEVEEHFHGLIDEVEIFNRALDKTEIQDIFQAGSAGKCKGISGFKFNDLNGNGVQDLGEPGLPGWPITTVVPIIDEIQVTTDANGLYCFTGLPPGTYIISETRQSGWTQTFPGGNGTHTVTVPPPATNINFGNTRNGMEICVFKFNDLNGNGVYQPGPPNFEPLLQGWQFNVTPNIGPAFIVTTLPGGKICFGVPAVTVPGNYTITEVQKPGWTSTTPTMQMVPVPLLGNVDVYFGNKLIPPLPPPDIALRKAHEGNLVSGQPGRYILTVTNVGPGPTTKPLSVTDLVPLGLTPVSAIGTNSTCTIVGQLVACTNPGPLAPNQSSTITLNVRVTAPAKTEITNCATVSTEGDANKENDRGCDTATVQGQPPGPPDLAIKKSALNLPWQVGGQGTFAIQVSNLASAISQGTVVMEDLLPAGFQPNTITQGGSLWNCATTQVGSQFKVTCTWPTNIQTVSVGPMPLITIKGTVKSLPLENCATVKLTGAPLPETNLANNTSCVVVPGK